MYVASLLENSVCYLPTGSGKTLVSVMAAVFIKRINPNKKVFFVCDRIPLVYQQAHFFRDQCDFSVGEFCGQNKETFCTDYDILVFTADFLINKLMNKSIYLEDCCCLIIDE